MIEFNIKSSLAFSKELVGSAYRRLLLEVSMSVQLTLV